LANDNAELRALLRRALELTRQFVVVAEADNGADAVQHVTTLGPDLALLDLSLPVRDGLEALTDVRGAAPGCAVAVISQFDAERIGRVPVEHAADLYLPEGASPQRLVAELLAVLQPPAPSEAAAAVRTASLRLPVALSSPREARQFLATQLAAWELDDLRETAELLVSELVTNAIVHAHSPSQLSVRVDGEVVHVEVEDWGGGALVLRDPDPLTPGGRGLRFVEALASRWGTASTGHGKSVWFELPVRADQPLVRAGD
jgi:DNA-binding NarL/FixJ family response regulator